jgi:hypothetical protein
MKDVALSMSEVVEVLDAMANMPPPIYFADGNSMTGTEAWNKCLSTLRWKLSELADKTPSNTIIIRKLPWVCGTCGEHTVQMLRAYNAADQQARTNEPRSGKMMLRALLHPFVMRIIGSSPGV